MIDYKKQNTKLKLEIAQLKELLTFALCKKGCGEIRIQLYNNDLICSHCGEEMFGQIPGNHFDYLLRSLSPSES